MKTIGRNSGNILAFITLFFYSRAAWTQAYLHDEIVDHRLEANRPCDNCDRELTTFLQYLTRYEAINGATDTSVSELEDITDTDFVVSRPGFLIHKGCFEEGRWSFDFEQAVLDSVVSGMSCLADGEKQYGETGNGHRTSTKYSLFPQFVDYLDIDRWQQRITPYSKKEAGTVWYDSCANVRSDPFFGSNMLDECTIVTRFGNRPKIFCDVDLSYQQLEFNADEKRREQLNKGSAYASAGSNDPIILNYQGQTKIYNGPTIVFKKDRNKRWRRRTFQSVLFHEMIHNLGYVHHDEKAAAKDLVHNDYAQFCQAACFGGAHPALTDADVALAREKCFEYEIDPQSARLATQLKEKM